MKVSGGGLSEFAATIESERTGTPEASAGAQGGTTPASNVIAANVGPAVPAWVTPEQLAEAQAQDDERLAALQAHFEGAPEKATDYKMIAEVGQGQIPPEETTALREAAHSIGVSLGEFSSLQHVLQRIDPAPLDMKLQRKAADTMGRELERRYGEERADAIARHAVLAITSAKGLNANVAAALRQEICTNRPLLELLARIGERHARKT